MNMNQLECFISLAKSLNFTKSSILMHITQPSFSRYISSLEEEVGIILFYRNKRSVSLTDAGKVFLEEAKKMIHHYNSGIIKAKQVENGTLGSINIGFLGPAARPFLPLLVKKIRTNHPHVEVKLKEYSHAEIMEAIRDNKIDVAFTVFVSFNSIEDLAWKVIFEDHFCVVLHCDHPRACDATINLIDMAKEPYVSMERKHWTPGYDRIERICMEHGFSQVIVSEERYLTSMLTLIECEVGYGIIPKSFKKFSSPNLRFIDIKNFNELDKIVVTWKKSNNNPFLPLFVDEVEKLIPYINETLYW